EFYRRMQRLLDPRTKARTEKMCALRWTALAGAVVLSLAVVCSAITVQGTRKAGAGSGPFASKKAMAQAGVGFRLSRQERSGGWLSQYGPAPTALVVRALLQGGVSPESEAVTRALAFLETFRQPDHGFYADAEPTYNTAIVLSTLALVPGDK